MDSPRHRAHILRREYSEVGIGIGHRGPGCATAARGAVYTTSFGRPPNARAGG